VREGLGIGVEARQAAATADPQPAVRGLGDGHDAATQTSAVLSELASAAIEAREALASANP